MIGVAVSLLWFALLVAEIGRSHVAARSWDGVSCCDPLDDITFVYLLALVPAALAVVTIVAARDLRRVWRGLTLASIYLFMAAVAFTGEFAQDLGAPTYLNVVSGVACLAVVTMVGTSLLVTDRGFSGPPGPTGERVDR